MALYSRALTLLSSCLENSPDSGPAIARLSRLCPALLQPSLSPSLSSLLGDFEPIAYLGQYPFDRRSCACLLALCRSQPHPATFIYLHISSLPSLKPSPDSFFVSSLCRSICQVEPTLVTTQVICLTLDSALNNSAPPVILGIIQALSQPPILYQSDILRDQLLRTLDLARSQITRNLRNRRKRHQWSQIQTQTICAISVQLQLILYRDSSLRCNLYGKALGVMGFRDDNEWHPTPKSPVSVDLYAACAQLCVSCALSEPNLSSELMHILMKVLKLSFSSTRETNISWKSIFPQLLTCVVRLCTAEHLLIGSTVDELKAQLEDLRFQKHSDYEDLHEMISSALADILRVELSIPGRQFSDTFARKLIFSLDHNLLIEQDDATMTDQSLLLLLGRVTSLVNNLKLTEHVIPMLVNRFTNSPKLLHIVIPHLTSIALLSKSLRIFNDVVSLLTNIYSKPFIPDNKWNRKEIPDALMHLATNVTAPDLRSGLLKSLLKLFKVLGRQIQERMEQSSLQNSSSMAGVLGFLLPALSALMTPPPVADAILETKEPRSISHFLQIQRHPSLVQISPWDPHPQASSQPISVFESIESDVKWFRTLWSYLVIYRFADTTANQLWPPAWANAVTTIAAHTPPLALSVVNAHNYDVQMFAETGISQICLSELRSRLALLYPAHASLSTSLQAGALTYIMTIDALESARVVSGTAAHIFAYLHDQTSLTIAKVVDAVADRVFQRFLDVMASSSPDAARRQNLESHVVFLLIQSCSRYQRVASKAAFYLKETISRFPFLQWSRTCLASLFELFGSLQELTSDIDLIPPPTVSLNIARLSIDLSDDIKSRASVQSHIQKMLIRWLENAVFTVPSHMSSMLQLFVQEWHDRPIVSPSFGVESSFRHLLCAKRQSRISSSAEMDSTLAQFAFSMTGRQRYLGDIRGRFFLFCQTSRDDRPFGSCMATDLLSEFHEILARHRLGQEDQQAQFRRCIYLSAALLVWSVIPSTIDDDIACQLSAIPLAQHRAVDPRELMHLVCMAPVYMFTDQSMACAIEVWSWLFAVSHAFSIGLLVTMKSAWAYTIESRLGLFSPRPDKSIDQFSGCIFTQVSPAYPPGWNASAPHDAWITFLNDRFDTINHCSMGAMQSVQRMMHKALSRPDFFCLAPRSFGPRFRLLLLGLRIVGTDPNQDLLRDRIMAIAFAWFYEGPRWMPHESWNDLTHDAQTIVSFIESIRRGWSSPPPTPIVIPPPTLSHVSRMGDNALVPSVATIAPSVLRSARPGTDPTDIFTATGSETGATTATNAFEGDVCPEIPDAVSIGIRWQPRHIDLLVLLMSHEFHRLVAWHNPRRHPDKMLPDENLYAHGFVSGLTHDHWRRYLNLAWAIHPHLAYRLQQRFPFVSLLRHLLRLKVQSQPLALRSIGEAVRLLINSKSCKTNSPPLEQVAMYESCSLPTALRLLCRPYSQSPIASQYTIRSLSRHAHSGVIFYMSEMIQALSHDSSGSLAKFLKVAGTQSPHLAHQLVWALQTESIVDETARRRAGGDRLPIICSRLERELIDSFSAEATAFFHAEFDFFEQITKLSSDLLTIPKSQKHERRARLHAELNRIRTDTLQSSIFPLYLPIDHTAQVVDIIVDTAKPLQSAARVPFLVEFLVKSNQEDEDQAPKIEMKQVIFKACDDCRQDCLALQFIRLCKDILKSAGLPLFLFPYVVIPNRTGPSRDLGGVIECVRQSVSRDEMGKANGLSLREYFLSKYGRAEGAGFKQAQRNFTLSMAGYAVCCYILQVKDRHNGNILLNETGHVIHIDFGFIFDISPAKDMKFESAGFKLTLEMVEVMDNFDSEMWNWFVDLCARGYLAVRAHRDDFLALADVMVDSALNCFKADSVRNLKLRFVPDKNERDAAQHMVNVVMDSYNKFTTNTYDSIQYLQQGIYYYAGQPS